MQSHKIANNQTIVMKLSRRDWHKLTFGGLVSTVFRLAQQRVDAQSTYNGVLIGMQSYSFRDMSLDQGISAMIELGITSCELWEGHVEPRELYHPDNREHLRRWRTMTPLGYFRDIRNKFDRAGIELSAYNQSFKDHFSDDEIERGFEITQTLGAPAITSSAQLSVVPRIAQVAERLGVPVAMHNHSRVDSNEFSSPAHFDEAIRLGGAAPIAVNLDIGHMVAANHDPLAYLQANYQRVVTLHLKDRLRNQGPNVPWGEGDAPIRETLLLLQQEQWNIPANIEYEYTGSDTMTELRRCIDFCKEVLS